MFTADVHRRPPAGLPDHADELLRIVARILETETQPPRLPDLPPDAPEWEHAYWRRRRERSGRMSARATPSARLSNPDAFLSRGDLRELGLERRAIDSIFRQLPIVALPGYSRPLIRVSDYLKLVEASTYDGTTRVRGGVANG